MERLSDYISKRGRRECAAAFVCSPAMLDHLLAGRKQFDALRAVEIEQATGITRRDLRPKDWWRIWPELITPEFPVPQHPQHEEAA